jgi:sugar phosphate permease
MVSIATSTAAFLLLFASNEVVKIAVIFMMGIFLSTGQLASFAYFWDLTVSEERGRVAGLIGFVSLPFYFIAIPVVAEALDFPATVILSIFLSLGPLVIILLRPSKAALTSKKAERGNSFEKRTVLFYSIPWIVFSLINATLARNISLNVLQQVSSSFYLFLTGLQVIGVIFGAVIGGIVADFFGRRLSLAISLTLYGISSALAGLIQKSEIFSLVYFTNGLGWGFLLILYTFVVWGDLANEQNCAKMYSIGLAIYYSAFGIGLLFPQISQIPLVLSALVSCLLIFLSNAPIIIAPELLPSYFREKIKLRSHMKAVRKINKRSQNQG